MVVFSVFVGSNRFDCLCQIINGRYVLSMDGMKGIVGLIHSLDFKITALPHDTKHKALTLCRDGLVSHLIVGHNGAEFLLTKSNIDDIVAYLKSIPRYTVSSALSALPAVPKAA